MQAPGEKLMKNFKVETTEHVNLVGVCPGAGSPVKPALGTGPQGLASSRVWT